MPLTEAQLDILGADIAADPVLGQLPLNDDAAFTISAAYNTTASPNYTVWRTNVDPQEILNAVTWTEYIGFTTQQERDGFARLTTLLQINMAKANIRQGFQDIFSGSNKINSRQAIQALGKRLATRAEKLFAGAPGTGTNGDPATMTFEGAITPQDVNSARAQ